VLNAIRDTSSRQSNRLVVVYDLLLVLFRSGKPRNVREKAKCHGKLLSEKTVCANSPYGAKPVFISVMHVISHRPHSSYKYVVTYLWFGPVVSSLLLSKCTIW